MEYLNFWNLTKTNIQKQIHWNIYFFFLPLNGILFEISTFIAKL